MKKLLTISLIAATILACSKEETNNNTSAPENYEFTRDGASTVDYSGQIERLDMLGEMSSYMGKANQLGNTVSGDTLKAMYKNEFGFTGTYSKNLFSKTFENDRQFFMDQMDAMALASNNVVNAKPGVAGVLNEEYPAAGTSESAGYLVNENGLEYKQIIEKILMGAVFFYQATEVYFGEDFMNQSGVDNQDLEDGKNYTAMEHHYDEAFGYAGIPTDFSSADTDKNDKSRVRFWGKYIVERSTDNDAFGIANLNADLMDAFIRGRTAIVNEDYTKRNEAIFEVVQLWEKAIAYTAGNYFVGAKTATSQYKRHHEISEGIAFLKALQYHFDNGTSVAPKYFNTNIINEALNIIGLNTNIYDVSNEDLDMVIAKINQAEPIN